LSKRNMNGRQVHISLLREPGPDLLTPRYRSRTQLRLASLLR
jgi:hypothetical protein